MPAIERWHATWDALGAARSSALNALYGELQDRYAEPHRAYHTGQHLDECFAHFDIYVAASEQAPQHPAEIELALWFHDAIYDRKGDNEGRSADWARDAALAAGIAPDAAARVHELILCTRHAAEPPPGDAQVLVDVDLSILAAPAPRFAEYEGQIRREYGWVPGFVFRRERRRVLQGFLDRPRIYATPCFHDRLEQAARANLAAALG